VILLLALLQASEVLEWDAKTLFERSTVRDVRLAGDDVEPDRGELFEDDGLAAGYS
jgi:hypothetical protein